MVDPFAGGGSIPLEALRVGCEAFASDLNPVACLILKVMLEEIPRHGPGLAEELRRVGGEVKAAAEKELADLYPPDPDGATPIAYLWARTVRCEAPNCGAEIPLLRSFWLCRKLKRRRALRAAVSRPAGEPPRVELEVFEPASERDVRAGTVTRAKAACPCCGVVLPPERVRTQLAAQRGGADVVFDEAGRRVGGARLTAVVTLRPGETGPALPAGGRCGLRGGARGAGAAGGDSRRVGAGREAGAVSGAGRADHPRAAGRAPVARSACSATGCSEVGRPVHGAAEGGVGGSSRRNSTAEPAARQEAMSSICRHVGLSRATLRDASVGRSVVMRNRQKAALVDLLAGIYRGTKSRGRRRCRQSEPRLRVWPTSRIP